MERHYTELDSNERIQLQQRIIHLRSEIISYKDKIKTLETELKKEKLRSEYLQEKLHEAQTTNIEQYEKKIALLENKLLSYEVALEEEKKQLKTFKENLYLKETEERNDPPSIIKIQSLFTYSLIIPTEHDDDILVIGDFTITNTGTEPLHDPIICFRITPKGSGQLNGKIATVPMTTREDFVYADAPAIEWIFAHKTWKEQIRKKGEYWIKPVNATELNAGEQLQFRSFEVQVLKQSNKNSLVVDAFVYCQEIPDGTPAMNKIIINF